MEKRMINSEKANLRTEEAQSIKPHMNLLRNPVTGTATRIMAIPPYIAGSVLLLTGKGVIAIEKATLGKKVVELEMLRFGNALEGVAKNTSGTPAKELSRIRLKHRLLSVENGMVNGLAYAIGVPASAIATVGGAVLFVSMWCVDKTNPKATASNK